MKILRLGLVMLVLLLATSACRSEVGKFGLREDSDAQNNRPLQSPCEADRWAIVPTQAITAPGTVGFKQIYVPLAVENNSQYWGQINTLRGDPIQQSYLTTEDGGNYPAVQQGKIETDASNTAQINTWWLVSSQLYTRGFDYIPPGFVVHGEAMIGFDLIEDGYGSPNTFSQAVYQVEETQKPEQITIPTMTISCIHQDGKTYEETVGPITLKVDEDLAQPSYPTKRMGSDFASITQPFHLPNQGLMELEDIYYEPGMANFRYLVARFKYTNTSTSIEKSIRFSPILLGDDGLSRRFTYVYGPAACSSEASFSASPGKTAEVTLCYLAGRQTSNFKFIWVDEEKGIFQIFDLPEGF